MKLELATDGACSGNPGPGGWGFVTADGELEGYGSEAHTTNQRMEVMAAARALLAVGKASRYRGTTELVVLTDSKYLVDCMTQKWYAGWERRGWKTASKTPVKHEQLWKSLIKLVRAWEARGTTVTFTWVKGHNGHWLNEQADKLAVRGRDEAKALAKTG